MTRQRLPDRRRGVVVDMDFAGTRYAVGIGFYPDGRPGEAFIKGARTGSQLDALLDDGCIQISLLLQHGVAPAAIAKSMSRVDGAGAPASAIGAVADLLAREPAGKGEE